jgi:hypothetical protein
VKAVGTGWALFGLWIAMLVPTAFVTAIFAVVLSALVGMTTGAEVPLGWMAWGIPIINTAFWAFWLPDLMNERN